MKKNYVVGFFLVAVSLVAGFKFVSAYSPTPELQDKIEIVVDKIEDLIDAKGGGYRGRVISALESLLSSHMKNERAVYILTYLIDAIGEESDGSLPESDYLGSYEINDATYGTEVKVELTSSKRVFESNGLPNHETGDFPNSGNPNSIEEQDYHYEMPLEITMAGSSTDVQVPGVAINGVFYEPGTAEFVDCSDGSSRHIEAIQDAVDLGLDFNEAHVQPGGLYHYHGVPTELIDWLAGEDDLVHIGFASDGALIYYSQSGAYSPSYKMKTGNRSVSGTCTYRGNTIQVSGVYDGMYQQDREYVAGYGDLDECNGTTINGEYAYLITDEYPYISRCANGTPDDSFRKMDDGGMGGPGGQMPPSGGVHPAPNRPRPH